MASYRDSLSKLFRPGIEGRYGNLKGDKGGETYCGVARNFHGNWSGWVEFDLARKTGLDVNGDSMFLILLPHLEPFYRDNFWTKIQGDALKDQGLADFLFACAVNMNSPPAVKLLQRAVGAKADGVLGPRTLATVNSGGPVVLQRFAEHVRAFYHRIATGDKARFLKGWLNRVALYVNDSGEAVA